jgi:16S rRNA (adenine(1408)-N(1))-methyltransferase
MIKIKGNKKIELTENNLIAHSKEYEEVIIDLGTGDGRFVYKSATENPTKLYIGIDPAEKQLEIYSKKAAKKKLYNALFLVGSIEVMPFDIPEFADKIYIILPWGSLLKNIVEPGPENISKITKLLKTEGNLHIILGYDPQFEPSETKRLELPEINYEYLRSTAIPKMEEYGNLSLQQQKTIATDELFDFETTWSKKLTFGSDRPLFQLILKKC